MFLCFLVHHLELPSTVLFSYSVSPYNSYTSASARAIGLRLTAPECFRRCIRQRP